jgi:hypothetical protein
MILSEHKAAWSPPRPSRASRAVPRKSSNHFLGQMTFGEEGGNGRCLQFESKLEHDVALLLIYHPGVVDVIEQVGPIALAPKGNEPATHFLDFVTVEAEGRRTGVMVKPWFRAQRFQFRDLAVRVRAAAVPGLVDRVVLVTEREVDPHKLARASLFHYCRFAQPLIDMRLSEAAANLAGPMTVRSFCSQAGLGTAGFHGTVRLIRRGALRVGIDWPIDLDSVVERGDLAP